MKLKHLTLCIFPLAVLYLSGCVFNPDGTVSIQPLLLAPVPVAITPAPVVEETVAEVPEDYVWDGDEFVGVVGDQYFYLGPGDVWIVADPIRLGQFHEWEHVHPDWRGHAIHNDRFRRDAHGRVANGHRQPGHAVPQRAESKKHKDH